MQVAGLCHAASYRARTRRFHFQGQIDTHGVQSLVSTTAKDHLSTSQQGPAAASGMYVAVAVGREVGTAVSGQPLLRRLQRAVLGGSPRWRPGCLPGRAANVKENMVKVLKRAVVLLMAVLG